MTQALPSSVRPDKKFRLRAAVGGPIRLWSHVRGQAADLSWVLVGKVALMGANAALMLFLAHRLELSTYGLLVITISGQLLISRLLMVGVDVGMVRLTGVSELKTQPQEVVTAGLVVLASTICGLLLLSVLATPILSWFNGASWIVPAIVAGSIGTSLVDYGYSFRLARQEYPQAAFAQGGTAIWRLGLTILAVMLLPEYPVVVFVAYHGSSLLSGTIQTLMIVSAGHPWPRKTVVRRLLGYSFWQGLANVIVIFSLYQGTFLLMLLNQEAETGIFGLGLTLSLGFFALYNAYSEYLLSRVRSVEQIDALPSFIKRALGASVVLIIGSVPLALGVAMLLSWSLRPELLEAVPVFSYLAASMVLLIFQAPLEAACHYLLRPKLVSFAWLMRALFIGVAGFVLAPRLGAVGAAIAQLIGSAVALFGLSVLIAGTLRSATQSKT